MKKDPLYPPWLLAQSTHKTHKYVHLYMLSPQEHAPTMCLHITQIYKHTKIPDESK